MSYPNYPNNRLIVNGVDLTEKFKMILADGYTLSPPSPKTYTIDIPGGNGKLDLTESLMGDTMYDNRTQEFTFYVIYTDEFEKIKTDVSNFLHGKAFDYTITMDSDYTYHGRFTVSSYEHSAYCNGIVGNINISIDANPFKYLPDKVYTIDAVGGITVYLDCGRKSVIPSIQSAGYLKVIYNGNLITLQEGTYKINDLIFKMGTNELYLNSYDIHNMTWGDLKNNSITWGVFKTKRLYEWYKSNETGNLVMKKWNDISDSTWNDLSILRWADLIYLEDIPDIEKVKIQYEWGDL